MAINTSAPVPVGTSPLADYFELAHIDTSNRDSGVVVEIWWNAFKKNDDGTKAIVANLGPHTIDGDQIGAVAADAFARAKAYEKQGIPAGLAYQGGYRDAMYAELQRAGKLPEGA